MALLAPWTYRSALLRAYAAAGGTAQARGVITAQLQGAAEELQSVWGAWWEGQNVSQATLDADQTWRDLQRLRKRLSCLSTKDERRSEWEAEVFGVGERLNDGDAACGRDREPPRWGDAWELASVLRQVEASGGIVGKGLTDVANVANAAVEDAWAMLPSPPTIPPLFPDLVSVAGVGLALSGVALFATSSKSERRQGGAALAIVGAILVGAAPRVVLAGASRKVAKAAKESATPTEGDTVAEQEGTTTLESKLDEALQQAGVRSFTARELLWLPKTLPKARIATSSDIEKDGLKVDAVVSNLVGVAKAAQTLRDEWGAPIVVRSAYRPSWYNLAVSGAKTSQHIAGKAMDITPEADSDHKAFQRLAVKLWDDGVFGGLGIYLWGGRIHIDTRSRKTTWTPDRVKELRK